MIDREASQARVQATHRNRAAQMLSEAEVTELGGPNGFTPIHISDARKGFHKMFMSSSPLIVIFIMICSWYPNSQFMIMKIVNT